MVEARARANVAQVSGLSSDVAYFGGGSAYPPGTYTFRYIAGAFKIDAAFPWQLQGFAGTGPRLVQGTVLRVPASESPVGDSFTSDILEEVVDANRALPEIVVVLSDAQWFGVYVYDGPGAYYNNSASDPPLTFELTKAVRA